MDCPETSCARGIAQHDRVWRWELGVTAGSRSVSFARTQTATAVALRLQRPASSCAASALHRARFLSAFAASESPQSERSESVGLHVFRIDRGGSLVVQAPSTLAQEPRSAPQISPCEMLVILSRDPLGQVGDDHPENTHCRHVHDGAPIGLQVHPLLHHSAEGRLHRISQVEQVAVCLGFHHP